MSQYTEIAVAIDQEDKSITQTGVIGIREENVRITLSGFTPHGGTDLSLFIILNGTLLASCDTFDVSGIGILDTNTTEMIAAFAGRADQSKRNLSAILLDVTNAVELANDKMEFINNPYQDGMSDPTDATAVGGGAYAPVANGVTNGDTHDHDGGDGGQIDHTKLSTIGTITHAQIDTHIANIEAVITASGTQAKINQLYIKDDLSGKWRRLFLYNGAMALGPEEA